MSHCCHQTRFWARNAPKMRLRPGLCPGPCWPCWGAYSAPPDPLAVFEGGTSRQGRGEGKGREEMERGGKGKEGRERGGNGNCPSQL